MSLALTPLALQNHDVLRWIADHPPRDGEVFHRAYTAELLGRVPSNFTRTLKSMVAADLIAEATITPGGWFILTTAGREALAALDRATQSSPAPAGEGDREVVEGASPITHAQIGPDPNNPRSDWTSAEAQADLDSLADSIHQDGLLQNLVVRPDPSYLAGETGFDCYYQLIAGERRWRAIGLLIARGDLPADWPIPVQIRDIDDAAHRRLALIENLKRRDLNPIEEARAFQQLIAAGDVDKSGLAKAINCTPRMIEQRLQLLQLDAADQVRLTLPKDDARRLTIEQARQKLANRTPPLELTPQQALIIAEIIVKTRTEDPEAGWWNATECAPLTGEQIAGLGLPDGIEITGPRYGTGRYGVSLGYHFGAAFARLHPAFNRPWNPAAAAEALKALRDEAVGDWPLEEYCTPWLNGPFELTEEGQAIVDENARREQDRADREERHREERLAAQQAAQQAADLADSIFHHAVKFTPPPPLDERIGAALALAGMKLPLAFRPANADLAAALVDADGEILFGGDRHYGKPDPEEQARFQLMALAINAAAGVRTPLEAPADPEDQNDEDDEVADLVAENEDDLEEEDA